MTTPDIDPEPPRQPSVPARTWVIGVALGVIASVAASIALFYVGLAQGMAVIGGLLIGGMVCGTLTRRRGPLQWLGAFALVLGGQWALGLLILAATQPR